MSGPIGPILTGVGQTAGLLGQILAGGGDKDLAERAMRMDDQSKLIGLVAEQAQNAARNKSLEAQVPITQMLLNRILGGVPGGLETANAMPRTFHAQDEQGNVIPGAASMQRPTTEPTGQTDFLGRPQQKTTYGQAMSPDELSKLIPNFSEQRQKQFAEVQALTSQVTPDKFQKESTLDAMRREAPGTLERLYDEGRMIPGLDIDTGVIHLPGDDNNVRVPPAEVQKAIERIRAGEDAYEVRAELIQRYGNRRAQRFLDRGDSRPVWPTGRS